MFIQSPTLHKGHDPDPKLHDAPRSQGTEKHMSMAGFVSWVAWRSAYLTRLGSIPKRMTVSQHQ